MLGGNSECVGNTLFIAALALCVFSSLKVWSEKCVCCVVTESKAKRRSVVGGHSSVSAQAATSGARAETPVTMVIIPST
jgi:hypothetical protein